MAIRIKSCLQRRYWPAWLTLVLGLMASTGLGWKLHREAVALDQKRLALRIKETSGQLEGRLEKTELLLRQLQDYLSLSGEPRDRVLDEWCRKHGLAFNHPWVHGISVLTNRHTASSRQNLPPSPDTWTKADWAALQELALNRPVECSLATKSGVGGKKQFLPDYELKGSWQETNRFISSIKKNNVRISRSRPVMLDAQKQPLNGCFFMVPVYERSVDELLPLTKRGDDASSGSIRWLHLTSMIVAPIDFKVLEQAVWGKVAPDLGVELFSSKEQTAETWLNRSAGGPRAADPHFKAYLTHRLNWPMYSDRFSIFFYTTPLFEAQSPRRLARIATFAGAAMTVLASALLGVALRAHRRQELLTDQIREARDALAVAEQQRQRLSHDLHDNTVQTLYAIQLGLGHTSQKLESEPAHAQRELSTVRAELDAVIVEIRRFITAEDKTEIAADLSTVLHTLVARVQVGAKAKLELRCDPAASSPLAGSQAVQLANIAREALSNSLRHGKPQRVEIALRLESGAVCLEVSDDGVGFDPKATGRQGVGLASMASRTADLGGKLSVQSSPGHGTRVVVRVPASPPASDEPE